MKAPPSTKARSPGALRSDTRAREDADDRRAPGPPPPSCESTGHGSCRSIAWTRSFGDRAAITRCVTGMEFGCASHAGRGAGAETAGGFRRSSNAKCPIFGHLRSHLFERQSITRFPSRGFHRAVHRTSAGDASRDEVEGLIRGILGVVGWTPISRVGVAPEPGCGEWITAHAGSRPKASH